MNSQNILNDAQGLCSAGKYEEALTHLMPCYKSNERNVDVVALIGYMYAKLERNQEAYDVLTKAKAIGLSDTRINNLLFALEKIIPPKKTKQLRVELPKMIALLKKFFIDSSDLAGFCVFLSHITLVSYFVLLPLLKAQEGVHPALIFVQELVAQHSSFTLSGHSMWLIVVFGFTALFGLFYQRNTEKTASDHEVFVRTRKIRTYHLHWITFLILLTATLYSNTNQFTLPFKHFIAIGLGIMSIFSALSLIWLLLPGARTTMQLLCSASDKSNRLCITEGILLKHTTTYLPQSIAVVQVKISPMWLFSLTDTLEIVLSSGEVLKFPGQSSFAETRKIAHIINTKINDSKVIQGHSHS